MMFLEVFFLTRFHIESCRQFVYTLSCTLKRGRHMYASVRDLRSHTKELLDAAWRGERVIITYRDKDYVELVPSTKASTQLVEDDPVFGMWSDNEKTTSVEDFVNNLRKPRHHVD